MSSKLVSQPFVLLTVTVVQVALKPVVIVTTCPGAIDWALVWPLQLTVTMLATLPTLCARRLTRRRDAVNSNDWLKLPETNDTLFVVKASMGRAWNHFPLPQSITPFGYWPLSG